MIVVLRGKLNPWYWIPWNISTDSILALLTKPTVSYSHRLTVTTHCSYSCCVWEKGTPETANHLLQNSKYNTNATITITAPYHRQNKYISYLKNQQGLQMAAILSLQMAPGNHSQFVSCSVGITSFCLLLWFPLLVSHALSLLCCLCS